MSTGKVGNSIPSWDAMRGAQQRSIQIEQEVKVCVCVYKLNYLILPTLHTASKTFIAFAIAYLIQHPWILRFKYLLNNLAKICDFLQFKALKSIVLKYLSHSLCKIWLCPHGILDFCQCKFLLTFTYIVIWVGTSPVVRKSELINFESLLSFYIATVQG